MSDSYRKDFSDKAAEKIKPDSEKSTYEKGKEFVTDKADKAAGAVQPEEKKGVFQGVSDSASKGKDEATGKTMSETAGEYVDAAKSKLNDAAEYVSKSLHGGDETK
ncbi:LAME_0A03136g1_1 [Lachancea meyersii CBS 8951]|uniref:LAME_0A03136g1_1 n=1 Tax=Lachancea meyersii CBS 8951 TaxID=1266667 RepID=A0A1G4IN64_9SACH|nr:LAME_0A03136g1_1 [Lachancea meyersii CBS 8951]